MLIYGAAQYKRCQRILQTELGVEPSAETTTLFTRLRAAGEAIPHNRPPQPTAFPGYRVQVHHLVAEGDFVSVIHTHFAKHTGPFMGMPPTGKEAVMNGVEVIRTANGKIVEFWRPDDDAGLLMQLGAIPAPA
jgi:hypothetical protein